MKRQCAFFVVLLFLSLVGCSSVPLGEKFSKLEPAREDVALVYIYRPFATPSSAFGLIVKIDGEEKAMLPVDSYTYVYLKSGPHLIEFAWPAISMQKSLSGNFDFSAGHTYLIRYSVEMGLGPVGIRWTYRAQLVSVEQGTHELACCAVAKPSD